ncbi:hypothetical protein BCV69DRAFT_276823 [Microstroma glucosiphilum]|uniref:Uncharacterized protein n=1 Tax=Pseudomicrostroma glucosiphilum TaxID=1684307 RepID=A0A316U7V8_9BASI|nr:hypothetical protein BCV69DRAFT_276823 [Pseudomicrostroma glucosiphilum]PWN21327.1 hypothetical protein BCV69DRAFT_276823 [Pseudomicrostroma glucosiphilum]
MFFNTCKVGLAIALSALLSCIATAAPTHPYNADGTVSCHARGTPAKLQWVDQAAKKSGFLGLNNKGQFELRLTLSDNPAYPQFSICDSTYIGSRQRGGLYTGHLQLLGKCIAVRQGGLHLDPCPMRDDESQTAATFGLMKATNQISAAGGEFAIRGHKGIQLFLA